MQNRRNFFKMAAATVASLYFMSGCWFDSVETDIETYGPILLQAVAGVVSLFDPALSATLAAVVAIVNAAIGALIKAVADCKAADAAQKPGLLGDIIATLQTV